MTKIIAPVIENAEEWLKENLKDLSVDSVSAVYPIKRDGMPEDSITLYDDEDGEAKTFSLAQQVEALQKLADLITGEKLFVGGLTSAVDLGDPCNWDVEVADAYFQLIYHGEVIYG